MNDNQTVGLRFRDLAIPVGSTIADAYVQFVAEQSDGGQTDLVINGQLIADASTFISSNSNITNRTPTSAQANWDVF